MTKPPSPNLSTWRRLQKSALEVVDSAAGAVSRASDQAAERLRDLDKAHGLTDAVARAGQRIQASASQVDDRYGLSDKATAAFRAAADGIASTASATRQAAEERGVTRAVREGIVDPLVRLSHSAGSSAIVRKTVEAAEDTYGATRRLVREVVAPDFPTYDSRELLQATEKELNAMAACILQISAEESSRIGSQFGRAVTAKIAGAASTSALLAAVAAFGHAGTGAAISGLLSTKLNRALPGAVFLMGETRS